MIFLRKDFFPNKMDINYPLNERFDGDLITCISLSSQIIKSSLYEIKKGVPTVKESSSNQLFENEEDLIAILEKIKQEYSSPYCALVLSGGFELILINKSLNEEKVIPDKGYGTILGSIYESGKKYINLTNPNFDKSLIFAFPRYYIQKIQQTITKGGFFLTKMECSTYNLLNAYLKTNFFQDARLNALIIADLDSLVILKLDGKNWQEVTFRNIRNSESLGTLLPSLLDRLEIQGNVGYYSTLTHDISLHLRNAVPGITDMNLAETTENPEFYYSLIY